MQQWESRVGSPHWSAIVPCATLAEFQEAVRTSPWARTQRVFRGQRNVHWTLRSHWERQLDEWRKAFREDDVAKLLGGNPEGRDVWQSMYLSPFKARAEMYEARGSQPPRDDTEYAVIGRHHGLVTPLLDWTSCPVIAAFFACFDYWTHRHPGFREGRSSWDGVMHHDPLAVWELACEPDLWVSSEFELVECCPDPAKRQRAQQGVFTVLTHATALDVETYLRSRGIADRLTQYWIAGSVLWDALPQFERMGISYGHLFPDLDGAAVHANTSAEIESLCILADQRASETPAR